jgi:PilZ domain
MAEARITDERRRFSRITFHRPALLHVGRTRAVAEVLDVSLKGALLEVGPGAGVQVDQPCALEIRLDAGDAIIRMEGTVVHLRAGLVGVRCDTIDLDSVAHLRRIVELNLADDALLHRELAALVRAHGS